MKTYKENSSEQILKMLNETVDKISHIRTWEDIKNVFKDGLDKYPGITGNSKQGDYGRMWKIKGEPLALKITTDPVEMEVADEVFTKGSLKGFLTIYEVVNLDPHTHNGKKIPKLQLRIQELCYPIKELGRSAKNIRYKNFLIDIVKGNYEGNFDQGTFTKTSDFDPFFRALATLKGTLAQDIGTKQDLQQALTPFLVQYVELLRRLASDIQQLPSVENLDEVDANNTNIMQDTKGTWKLIDF